MKKTLLLVLLALTFTFDVFAQADDINSTTLIFVRHAEKVDDGTRDPALSTQGEDRAILLKNILSSEFDEIAAIFSTPYKRTQSTAKPTAEHYNVEVEEYGLKDPKALLISIIEKYSGETVLIVGHSNTTPTLVNVVLGEERYPNLDESVYNQLYILKATKIGEATVDVRSYDTN